jgi:hypothetical protein
MGMEPGRYLVIGSEGFAMARATQFWGRIMGFVTKSQ